MNALLGSGFFASNEEDFMRKYNFFVDTWLPNVGERDIVVVDNSEPPVEKLRETLTGLRVISVNKNLGHVGNFLGQQNPKLCGWSMSWILPAMIAYCECRDFIYQEADCLAFGDCEKQMYADAEAKDFGMVFGEGSKVSATEQCLMLIKHWFILDAINLYLSQPDGDGVRVPESKFEDMERGCNKIGRHTLQGGRNRPLPMNEKTFYGQKYSQAELDQLKIVGLIK